MNQYTIYNTATGEITGYLTTSFGQVPDRTDVIPGRWDRDSYRVVDHQAVSIPTRPTGDLPYEYSADLQVWVVDHDQAAVVVRDQRNQLLAAIDRINPVWYNSLTASQQSELAEYRLALLAVPQQVGFPGLTNWPAKPAWL